VDSTEIKQVNHYYAFGLNMEGNWNAAGGTNKYQYNGKEWNDDFGLGLNDYGARFYDAAIGRFTAADPLSIMFAPMSPYQYARNSPINFVDPTGMASEAVGADGMTNNQWRNATRAGTNGSQAANGSGSNTKAAGYKQENRNKEVERLRLGQKRETEEDDIDNNASLEITRGTLVRDEQGNEYGGTCECGCPGKPDCNTLNPATLGKNIAGTTYPGGNNPMTFNGLPDYSYNPGYRNLFEYPAIGHDRAYDKLGIKGVSGLFLNCKSIGADWRFVKQEFQIAIYTGFSPYFDFSTSLKAIGFGVGLGLAATPKTIIFRSNPFLIPWISKWGYYSNSGTSNRPSK
jgi:RHS repeat-associated protein